MHRFIKLILLVSLSAILLTACRTAKSLKMEERDSVTIESAQSSETLSTSFFSAFSKLALQADSIVFWMDQGHGRDRDFAPSYDPDCLSPDSVSIEMDLAQCGSCSTAQPKSRNARGNFSKVVISGLRLETLTGSESSSCDFHLDSITDKSEREAFHAEEKSVHPPDNKPKYFFWILLVALGALAALYLKRKFF